MLANSKSTLARSSAYEVSGAIPWTTLGFMASPEAIF
jgi:hypothetical protein